MDGTQIAWNNELAQRRLLEDSARDSALFRGHNLHPFVQDDLCKSHSACKTCGRGVYVNTRPAPNEIEIHGEAVALNCGPRRV